jgi:hypothetical protein
MRKAMFSIESLSNQIFEGYTQDETWNGWACPYFTFEEASKIVEAQRKTGEDAWYDQDSDQFIFRIQGEEEVFPAIQIQNLKVYSIGSTSWIWDEIESGTFQSHFQA